ncbi:YqiJ family protein [Croceicoccus pelagius]|uniref:DUF1449 family protein n=1 Tax=Croceicoccus pelagius TaxID=1703341 RepID=A0A917DGD6_9SPHN|nr:YqiJ family protein [Croceicoccus pelagius]GGD38003.1 hypothetical protein GCM10010989_10160 [Croceicoccus pelagius]
MDILATHNTPFAVALAFLLLLLVVQLLGLGDFGPDFDGDIDVEGPEAADVVGGLASIVGLDRLPLVAWLALFCASFGLIGLSLQELLTALIGAPLPAAAAAVMGVVVGLPATGLLARPLGRIWPHDETTAVSVDELLGRRGTISIGTARRGSPARAQVTDRFGQSHNVMVEPHEDAIEFIEGDEVMLVRREDQVFFAIGGSEPFRLTH